MLARFMQFSLLFLMGVQLVACGVGPRSILSGNDMTQEGTGVRHDYAQIHGGVGVTYNVVQTEHFLVTTSFGRPFQQTQLSTPSFDVNNGLGLTPSSQSDEER